MKKRNSIKNAIDFALLVDKFNSYVLTDSYLKIANLGRKLHRLDEQYCNGELTDEQSGEATHRVYVRLEKELEPLGLNFYHQTDPRGCSLYVGKGIVEATNYTNNLAILV